MIFYVGSFAIKFFANLESDEKFGWEKCAHIRDEQWTGLGWDWIRHMPNFVESGLDPDSKLFHKYKIRTGFGLS